MAALDDLFVDPLDAVYRERNELVAALSKLWPAHLCEDARAEAPWSWVVCIHAPVGQLTWHVHEQDLALFPHLTIAPNHWDGHSTKEKYERLRQLDVATAKLGARS